MIEMVLPAFLKEYKPAILKSLVIFLVIVAVVFFLSRWLVWWQLALCIAAATSLISIGTKLYWRKQLYWRELAFGFAKTLAVALGVLFLAGWSAKYGLLGLVGFVVVVAVVRMVQQREFLGRSKAEIECMIWGYPARQKWRNRMGFSQEHVREIRRRRQGVSKKK